ncbi:MAG: hypothetical protein GTO14_00400, partial [Anaerolineales bacterium]|nr:hypothetical protein [Anaerolineales bacterium]
MGEVEGHGSVILADFDLDYVLVLGGGGERIHVHQSEETLPKKHQLLIHFQDSTYLTVTVQGWGNVLLIPRSKASEHPHVGVKRVFPHLDEFTYEHLLRDFQALGAGDTRSV